MSNKIRKEVIKQFEQYDVVKQVRDVLTMGIYDAYTETFVAMKKENKNLIMTDFTVTEFKDKEERPGFIFACRVVDNKTNKQVRTFSIKVLA